jgi:hypothetical protein
VFTHEGGRAKNITPAQALRRSVMSCLLWEDGFYEDGKTHADRVAELCGEVSPLSIASIAIEARGSFHLRHISLFLACQLAERHTDCCSLVRSTIRDIIQRVDEIPELVALWWKDGKRPLSNQMKKGLADAFRKFNAYEFQKYANRDGAVKLRDVMFLVHPKPSSPEQAEMFKAIADKTLPPADTWEVALSSGADKGETFTRLLREGKLGYLALLRNLRNMVDAQVDMSLLRAAIISRRGASRVLPFRYVAAARACPSLENEIDIALCEAVAQLPRLPGRTVVLVDVSGSMSAVLSSKSDMRRIDAAAALACIVNAEQLRVFSFADSLVEVPPRRGMAGVDAIRRSQPHGGTYLGQAVTEINSLPHDRLIVITDEQTADIVPDPVAKHAYMINAASNEKGVGYGKWTHIDGWSDGVLRFISEQEGLVDAAT